MKLPQAELAIIDREKLLGYCLSPDHDEGKHKALLFEKLLGLTADKVDTLVEMLRRSVREREAAVGKRNDYGQNYIVDFDAPSGGKRVTVRSVWIVRTGESAPRLVTCYIM